MVGQLAPGLVGEDVQGKKIKLSDLRGKVVLVDFWFTRCGPCRSMVPDEHKMVKRLDKKPFVLLGVSVDEDGDELKSVLQEEKITWPCVWDKDQSLAAQWEVQAFPTLVLIDQKGIVRYQTKGVPNMTQLNKHIDNILAEGDSEA